MYVSLEAFVFMLVILILNIVFILGVGLNAILKRKR